MEAHICVMAIPKYILPIIVLSQFCCTSLWFAGNAVMADMIGAFGLDEGALGHLTSAVQFGFISGTLVFAILTISDRYSPSLVFMVCALFGAIFNLGVIWEGNSLMSLVLLRFLTGFSLAGIYPVGMKIAADYFERGLGLSLGYLVGALVLGTAFPHFLKLSFSNVSWFWVIGFTSFIALLGGLLVWRCIPNGPYRKKSQRMDFSAFFNVFRNRNFRSAAFGYFGHMWELYAFWAFVPVMISNFNEGHMGNEINVSLFSFIIIAIGSLGCIAGGYTSLSFGPKRTAFAALFASFLCCLISGFVFEMNAPIAIIIFLCFWGFVVVADSPLFSTLVAQNASVEIKGTALTIVNCIGFAISILTIQILNHLSFWTDSPFIYSLLSIGPLLGLVALLKKG